MAKVVFKRVENRQAVDEIPILDGQLIYTKEGLSYIDYGESRTPMIENKDYSTDEKIIGQFIDGKPVYRKVIRVNSLVSTSSYDYLNIPHGISNFKTLVKLDCIANNGSNAFFDFNNYTSEGASGMVQVFVDNTNIIVYNGVIVSFVDDVYFILEYTKTSD